MNMDAFQHCCRCGDELTDDEQLAVYELFREGSPPLCFRCYMEMFIEARDSFVDSAQTAIEAIDEAYTRTQ